MERDHLEERGIDGRNIFKNGDRDMDWIALAEGTDRWRAVVNEVMNHRVP